MELKIARGTGHSDRLEQFENDKLKLTAILNCGLRFSL